MLVRCVRVRIFCADRSRFDRPCLALPTDDDHSDMQPLVAWCVTCTIICIVVEPLASESHPVLYFTFEFAHRSRCATTL